MGGVRCAEVRRSWAGQPVSTVPPDHLLLDSVPNLGPLISCWEINKFKNLWNRNVRILEVSKLLFQQFLNLPSSQEDMSGPILGALCNNRWSGGTATLYYCAILGTCDRPLQQVGTTSTGSGSWKDSRSCFLFLRSSNADTRAIFHSRLTKSRV
jgi:hypothetical protein